MSSNLAVEEPMAADLAENPGGDELRGDSSVVESTEGVEIRGSVETIVEENTTVVVAETKVELIGSELGSEDKSTGGLQGDDQQVVSLKNPSCVESSVVDGVEEVNDPTEISLDDLTGGLDIDGKPTGGHMEEVVIEEGSVETDMAPRSNEVAGKAEDTLVDSVSVKKIQEPESRPNEQVQEPLAMEGSVKEPGLVEGIQEDETVGGAGECTSVKEAGEGLDKGRSVDWDKPGDKLEKQIAVEELKNVITPLENVIEASDMVKVLEEGADGCSAKAAIVGQSKDVDTSNNPNVDEVPMVKEDEDEVEEITTGSCTEPMNVIPSAEVLAGPVHFGNENVSMDVLEQVTVAKQADSLVVGTHVPMDIDGIYSEIMEMESAKGIGGDYQELKAGDVNANKENSKLGTYNLIWTRLRKYYRPGCEIEGIVNNLYYVQAGTWYSQPHMHQYCVIMYSIFVPGDLQLLYNYSPLLL